jgi:predicted nucleotidyltransferase component of viral defense system
MKFIFDREEKREILSILRTWKREQITFERFREIQAVSGVPARLVETVFWLEDTLDALQDVEHLYLKGGTCVQIYIPPMEQRASVDIDMNTDIANPNALRSHVLELNERIHDNGRSRKVRGVEFGTLAYEFDDKQSGTLSFKRRMPSRFGEFESFEGKSVMSKSIRVQINYKNAWLPAMKVITGEPTFFINEFERPQTGIDIRMESSADLFADKLLAVCNVGGFGRERFKDVYDLIALRHSTLSTNESAVLDKLNAVAAKSSISVPTLLKGAADTVTSFSDRTGEVRGFSSMVCKAGKERIRNWETECEELADSIDGLRTWASKWKE